MIASNLGNYLWFLVGSFCAHYETDVLKMGKYRMNARALYELQLGIISLFSATYICLAS